MGNAPVPERLGYQPALDGLRAVAVLAVLLYHDRWVNLPGGFLGVDIFFVLSGFLITGILVADDATNGTAISANFWVRRLRRLLPAFLVMLVLVAAYTYFVGNAVRNADVRGQGLFALLAYFMNWQAIYWTNFLPTVFSHVWSLSVEEQWYLVWPFLLAGILFVTRRRTTAILAVVIALGTVSATLMWYLASHVYPSRAFFGTDTRAWELLAGAALAIVVGRPRRQPRRARRAIEVAGIAALLYLVWTIFTFSDRDLNLYPGARLLVVLAAVVVIFASIREDSAVLRRGLAWRPLVGLGLISYGVYLYHVPIFSWLSPPHVDLEGLPLLLVRIAAVLAFATVSYKLIEMPVRRGHKLPLPNWLVLPIAVGGTVLLFIVATLPTGHVDREALTLAFYRNLATTTPRGTTRVLVAGDETAFELGWQMGSPFEEGGVRGTVVATLGCGIVGGTAVVGTAAVLPRRDCDGWANNYREARQAFDPQVTVLMVGNAEVVDRRVNGVDLPVGSPAWTARLTGELDRGLRALVGTGHTNPLVLLTVPCADPQAAAISPWAAVRRDPIRVVAVNRVIEQFAAAHPGSVTVAALDRALCPGADPHPRYGDVELRPDGVTLSPVGARVVWRWLAPIARAVADGRGATQ